MPVPDEQPSQHDHWDVVVCCSLLGTGVPGMILAVVGMTTNRDWLAIVGYVLAAPLMALVSVMAVVAQVTEWRQRR
jgi:hypothetical protein